MLRSADEQIYDNDAQRRVLPKSLKLKKLLLGFNG